MTTKNIPLTHRILDRLLLRICFERYNWPPYWPSLWHRHPRKITAGALRRTRLLVTHARYGEVFRIIIFQRWRTRMEEWGAWTPNPTGVWTSIGEKRFQQLWRKYKGDTSKVSSATANSTPSVKAYAEQLGLLENRNT